MTRALGLLVAWLALAPLALAQEAPPLRIRVKLDRESVLLHEQVVMSLEIVHPPDARASWEPPPFDGFWAERLTTRALADDPSGLHRTEFRRALFPTRAGTLEIAASRLTLEGEGGAEQEVPVPGASVRVRPLPAGVPPETLVGALEIHLVPGDDRVRLGKSLPLTIELAGDANVWDAAVPALEQALGPGVEVFAEAPRVTIGETGGRATTRRTFRYALVPSSAGRVRMEPLTISYLDPKTGKVELAKSEALAFDVFEGGAADEPRSAFKKRVALSSEEPWPLWPFLLLGLAGIGFGAAFVGYARRVDRAHAAAPGLLSPRSAFDAARAARGSSEFHALLARAVRAGVGARHKFDAQPLTSNEIAARGAEREAVDLLEALDRARFARRSADDESLLERARAYLAL
ncbi:MAG TPA: BatD family protein [Myxococcota bacterium]|nr:BatD family protein [Myxococcota bacterium]